MNYHEKYKQIFRKMEKSVNNHVKKETQGANKNGK